MFALVTIPRSATTITRESPNRSLSLVTCDGQRLVVVQLAGEHLDRDRPARHVAQQPVDDLRQPALPVPRVPQLRQRTRPALEVTRGHVIEHHLTIARGDARRDDPRSAPGAPAASPSPRRDHPHPRPPPPARSASVDCPRVRTVPSFDPGQITRPRIIAMHRSRSRHGERSSSFASSKPAGHRQRRVHVPGRERALDLERVIGAHQRLAGQHPPDRVDRLRREMREVRERFLLDLPALTVGAPQQRRRCTRDPPTGA